MNRLSAIVDGQEIDAVMIHTGSKLWSARRVPARWAKRMLAAGATFCVETARGKEPRRLIDVNGVFYTRANV